MGSWFGIGWVGGWVGGCLPSLLPGVAQLHMPAPGLHTACLLAYLLTPLLPARLPAPVRLPLLALAAAGG